MKNKKKMKNNKKLKKKKIENEKEDEKEIENSITDAFKQKFVITSQLPKNNYLNYFRA